MGKHLDAEQIDKDLVLRFLEAMEVIISDMRICRIRISTFLEIHPEMSNAVELEESCAGKRGIDNLEWLFGEIDRFFVCHEKMGDDELPKGSFRYCLTLIGIDAPHFGHNLATVQVLSLFATFQVFFDKFHKKQNIDGYCNYFSRLIPHLPDVIEQTLAHLQTVVNDLRRKLGIYEQSEEYADVIETVRIDLGSRVFFGELRLQRGEIIGMDTPVAIVQANSDVLSVPIPAVELCEILYAPISNATKVLEDVRDQGTSGGLLRVEASVHEVLFEGQRIVAVEIFNTGRFINIVDLHRAMTKFDPRMLHRMSPQLQEVVNALQEGSRQASLHTLDPTSVLFLNGFTMGTGGTGIGLADMERLTTLHRGAVMINNVYSSTGDPLKEGVCVTVLLPGDQPSGDFRGLRVVLKKLKALMQKGRFQLDRSQLREFAA